MTGEAIFMIAGIFIGLFFIGWKLFKMGIPK